MSAYHAHRRWNVDAKQASAMPVAVFASAGSLALRVCDATRVMTQAPCRDTKWEVDSKAEVNGS